MTHLLDNLFNEIGDVFEWPELESDTESLSDVQVIFQGGRSDRAWTEIDGFTQTTFVQGTMAVLATTNEENKTLTIPFEFSFAKKIGIFSRIASDIEWFLGIS